MASGGGVGIIGVEDTIGVSRVKQIPEHLLGFVQSQIRHYVDMAKDFSAEIHEIDGKTARLVFYHGRNTKNRKKILDNEIENRKEEFSQDDGNTRNAIVVANVPSAADEDVLELLFESKRKGGGGPIKGVQLNRQKKWAIIEFCEPGAVEAIIRKLPITLMGAELDIHPYTPLISAGVEVNIVDIREVPKELTDKLLTKDIEGHMRSIVESSDECKADEKHVEPTLEVNESQVVLSLEIIQLRMLTMMKFQRTITEKFPNARIEINLEKTEIVIIGDTADIQSIKMKLYESLSTYVVCVFDNFSPSVLQLYQCKRVTEYINKKLATENLACLWERKDECLIVCGIYKEVIKCADIIRESVKEEKFEICKETSAVLFCSQWKNKLKELRKDSDLTYEVMSNGEEINASVFACSDEVTNIARKVKVFLKEQSNVKSETVYLDQLGDSFIVFSKAFSYDIWSSLFDRISRELSIYYVSVKGLGKCYYRKFKFTLTGTDKGRALAKERLKNINIKC